MTTALARWLLDAKGHLLERVQGEFYQDSKAGGDKSPLAIWLQFAGVTRAKIFGRPDGWGIDLDETPPMGADMGSAGRTVIRNLARVSPFVECVGSTLQEAAIFKSSSSEEPVGIRLRFASKAVVLVLNWGDELLVDNQPPRDATVADLVVYPLIS